MEDNIKLLKQIAIDCGDKCLSDACKEANTTLWQECDKGHRWEVASARVRSTGIWCPICADVTRKITIGDMQDLAAKRGGRCLSEAYEGAHTKLFWECAEGHQWEAIPSGIKNGSWCPSCAGNAKHTIEEMQGLAEERGGRCLSDTYKNNITRLLWECSEGHQWEAMPMKVISGNWCRECYVAQRKQPKQKKTA